MTFRIGRRRNDGGPKTTDTRSGAVLRWTGGIAILLFLAVVVPEVWVRTAMREYPWQLDAYANVTAAGCRTVPGSSVFKAEIGDLDAQVLVAEECLHFASSSSALNRDFTPCVRRLLGVALSAQRLSWDEAARSREMKSRLDAIAATLDLEIKKDAEAKRAGAKFEVRNEASVRARTLLETTRNLAALGQMDSALLAGLSARMAWSQSEHFVTEELSRFNDVPQRALWDNAAQALLRGTERSGNAAILVDKLEHRCLLLAHGRVEQSYPANLGTNWYHDKVQERDASTPEGEYRIKRKFRSGKYGWALLLDFPNASDRQRFDSMKKTGKIPASARIGGNIELHGGGRLHSDWTEGCVSLEDRDMAELYRRAYVGMPVTIVGASRLAKQ